MLLTFQGEDPSMGNPNFWDELFLLKVWSFLCIYFFDIMMLLLQCADSTDSNAVHQKHQIVLFITSAKEALLSPVFVHLLVIMQKVFKQF